MRSFKSRIFNLIFKFVGAKKMFADFHAAKTSSAAFQAAVTKARLTGQFVDEPALAYGNKYPYQLIDIDGSELHIHEMGNKKRVVLFLHGGAYVLGISKVHWDFLGQVGEGSDSDIAMFDYQLAPEHDCEIAIDRTLQAYDYLLTQYDAKDIVLMGGSAGGGLAMGLSLHLRSLGRPQPSAIVLNYPWLDVTMSHPEARPNESNDLLLGVDGLIACGEYYAGNLSVEDPLVSPWFGSFENIPPVHIFTGTWDVLHAEGRDFYGRVKGDGCEAHLYVYPEMQHAWLLFGLPESVKGIAQINNIIGQVDP